MSSHTLYEIRDDLEAISALLYDIGGDVTEADVDAAITEWLTESTEALKDKLDAYGALIREQETLSVSREEEAKRLLGLSVKNANFAKRLRARLQWFFEDQGLERMETERFRFTLANNGGKVPVHVHVPPETLPEWAKRVHVVADSEAIRDRLVKGEDLGFAHLGERGRHLRVG